jgi:hypothetical protein
MAILPVEKRTHNMCQPVDGGKAREMLDLPNILTGVYSDLQQNLCKFYN